jgi:cytochrome c553
MKITTFRIPLAACATVAAALFLAVPDRALAADPTPPPAGIADLVQTCAACHGADGVPVLEDAPIIWGQENYYLYVQMKDMKSGLRASETMAPVVANLEKDTMKALAAYFADQKWPDLQYQTPAADEAIGANLAVAGQCPQCHLGAWVGNSRVPRLAGQNVLYLQKTMLDFKYKRRMNAPDIAALFKDLSDDEVMSMAHYAAGR